MDFPAHPYSNRGNAIGGEKQLEKSFKKYKKKNIFVGRSTHR